MPQGVIGHIRAHRTWLHNEITCKETNITANVFVTEFVVHVPPFLIMCIFIFIIYIKLLVNLINNYKEARIFN